jgi:hypothetical protein
MSKVKFIISDEPAEIIIQQGLNLNRFKKRIPHLLIKYVLSFLSTKPKDNFIETNNHIKGWCDYKKFYHYESTPYGWWNKMRMEAFHDTFKKRYLPIIIQNFETKIKKKSVDIYVIRDVFSRKQNQLPNLDRVGIKRFMEDLKALNPIHYNKKQLLCLLIISRCISTYTATCGCDKSKCHVCNKHLCRSHKMENIGQGRHTCMDCLPNDKCDLRFCSKCSNLQYQYDTPLSKSAWREWVIGEGQLPCVCDVEYD